MGQFAGGTLSGNGTIDTAGITTSSGAIVAPTALPHTAIPIAKPRRCLNQFAATMVPGTSEEAPTPAPISAKTPTAWVDSPYEGPVSSSAIAVQAALLGHLLVWRKLKIDADLQTDAGV